MTSKYFAFIFSIAAHVAILIVLVWSDGHPTRLSALWRGGSSGAGVVMIDLATLNGSDVSNDQMPAMIQNTHPATPGASRSAPAVKHTSMAANSNTGNGSGAGLDATGAADPSVLAQIRKKIFAAKTYPQNARAAGEAGKVKVSFLISPDGSLASAAIVASSGFANLDAAALSTLHHAVPLPFYPQPIVLTLEYRLENEEGLTW